MDAAQSPATHQPFGGGQWGPSTFHGLITQADYPIHDRTEQTGHHLDGKEYKCMLAEKASCSFRNSAPTH